MGWFKKDDRNLTDYEKFNKLSPGDTLNNRDVYNGQQVGRTRFKGKQSPTSRHLFAGALTFLIVIIAWFFISMITWVNEGGLFQTDWSDPYAMTFGDYILDFTFGKFLGTLSIGVLFFAVMDLLFMKTKMLKSRWKQLMILISMRMTNISRFRKNFKESLIIFQMLVQHQMYSSRR